MQSLKLVQSVLVFCGVALMHLHGVQMKSAGEDETNDSVGRIIYDQRQSGKYNIHVVIKDVAIIEMGQNEIEDTSYNDEEYYYDENDMTVKPITLNPPTTKTKLSPAPITSTAAVAMETNPTTSKINIYPAQTKIPATSNVEEETTSKPAPQDEETTLTSSVLWNSLSSLIAKRPSKDQVPPPSPNINTSHIFDDIKARSKVEPIYAIEENPLPAKSRDDSIPLEQEPKSFTNSKIYKVKLHRSHQPHHYSPLKIQSRRCRSNQYRDLSGNCRIKRSPSGSFLSRLFSMLVTLPAVRGEQQRHNED